jgi:acyl-CoA thioester hydrolase
MTDAARPARGSSLPRLDRPPTLEEAVALPLTLSAAVEPRFIDPMGHMNVSHYLYFFDRATWGLFARFGIDEASVRRTSEGMFAVEHHLRYLAELREGDPLEVHSRVLEVQPKSVVIAHAMVDRVRGRVCATCEVVGVHIDLQTRRALAFDAGTLAALRAAVL